MDTNDFGLPIGRAVPGWTTRPAIEPVTLHGRTCVVEPVRPEHLPGLHQALDVDSPPQLWSYYPAGPFGSAEDLAAWVDSVRGMPAVPHAVVSSDGRPLGVASYLRVDPRNGSAEVGAIVSSAALQRTTASTESMYLMMRHVFDDLGYRRYEWKCDALNAASRQAASRYGFTYEGTFRNAVVYRDRNRDTDWFAITDDEWPLLRTEFERWLAPGNFDENGAQLTRLDTARALGHPVLRSPRDR